MTRVIVTRPDPDGAAFARKAVAAGFDPILSPVMKIVFRNEGVDLSDVGALAFTSANGVRAFAAATPAARGLPVFAVGDMTAAAARTAGFAAVEPAGGDVSSISSKIAGAASARAFSGAVLHGCGAERAGDLVRLLKQQGVNARRAVLYDAIPLGAMSAEAVDALKAEPPAGWAALFSPRSARLFIEQVHSAGVMERLGLVRAACLSNPVAEAAAGAPFGSIEVAEARSTAAMIALMKRRSEGPCP